ncbi:MAG: LPS export ABC transporter permease LptG [Burkholderiales bacterium 35-55-47]|jgi:lipopolysaccharide export system permease protein|uniref:LPS export ABC transporter permease LptG n=1 Tax=Limnohabitans sp. TaxID=1907725 RepID=UPI000BCB0FE9|nr:LPS export ABC transporter permease LptG [Limnohabitans sp.]OYY18715.1 MAG: LPS export ABC transporter permease LptG [Burkholderiales bacterium 35-55-47]OYZ73533.1 MAG: LPS export ABC transporter permease LptG [Burkholderiales bacterium 24-55-52]OZB00679.1 MAG: LPS export ABC transporter permease LptG [Burkholderiales bacterium 39-55-53]HQR85575.1 LPS export ABC transporter permease LptG [Limnohabitans sp.]HQS26508.1 LPS export ABC transporter permease LptG [Limnohabitans sp.]
MKTLRKLIHAEVWVSVAFVTLCFVALFFFFDFIDELPNAGGNNNLYQIKHVIGFVLFSVPSHLYELLPITVLIGTIFVMSRLAQSSEFTILRTSGLTPIMALRSLMGLGLIFVLITFAVGDYIAPISDRYAQLLKSTYLGTQLKVGHTGAWLRENTSDKKVFLNINQLSGDGSPKDIRIFEFNEEGGLIAINKAASAHIENGTWLLRNAERSELKMQSDNAHLQTQHAEKLPWASEITSEMISVAILKPSRMSTIDLFQYIRHLSANGQSTQRFEIEFWKKVFYPLSCLVMVVLALPFAYLHSRSGNIASNVFGGVLAGISFFLLNNVFSYLGNINNWTPWFAAAAPGILYSIASLTAFGWLVVRQ